MREPGWIIVFLLAIAYIIYAISVELFKLVFGVGFVLTVIALIIGAVWLGIKVLQYGYREFKEDPKGSIIVLIIVAVPAFWCTVCMIGFEVYVYIQYHASLLAR